MNRFPVNQFPSVRTASIFARVLSPAGAICSQSLTESLAICMCFSSKPQPSNKCYYGQSEKCIGCFNCPSTRCSCSQRDESSALCAAVRTLRVLHGRVNVTVLCCTPYGTWLLLSGPELIFLFFIFFNMSIFIQSWQLPVGVPLLWQVIPRLCTSVYQPGNLWPLHRWSCLGYGFTS